MTAHFKESPPITGSNKWPSSAFETDEIVISGMSGRFPESDDVWQFSERLYKGEDMITEDDRRWPPGYLGLPSRQGKIKDLSKFDATFFGVHPKQANAMDPQIRLLLETSYEAIFDSGINPQTLRGSKTGVYVANSTVETDDIYYYDTNLGFGYVITGNSRAMLANRISYAFDFKGPSVTTDTACSSGIVALDLAVKALRNGDCDYALLSGANITVRATTSLQFMKLGMLSIDGKCRTFDNDGIGYVRSEAVVAYFLQRKSTAKRVYATILHTKTNTDGNKIEGVTYPSGLMQERLLRETYSEAKVNPADVAYIETHGTGTPVGDPQEINAITRVFCADRKDPLLIGSVKSNMGHSEAASGLCSIAKVLLAESC